MCALERRKRCSSGTLLSLPGTLSVPSIIEILSTSAAPTVVLDTDPAKMAYKVASSDLPEKSTSSLRPINFSVPKITIKILPFTIKNTRLGTGGSGL
jgi:hypothetical protein